MGGVWLDIFQMPLCSQFAHRINQNHEIYEIAKPPKHSFCIENEVYEIYEKVLFFPYKEMIILNIQEANTFLAESLRMFPNDDTYPILYLALFTGLREGELFGLEWSKVDLNAGKAKVRQQFRRGAVSPKLKTFSSYREIDLAPSVVRVLQNHRAKNPSGQKFVFANQAGNPHSARNFIERRHDKIFASEACKEIKRVKFHELRHTYVSLLLSQGVPEKYIQKQVGHSRISTTMDIYAHLIPDVNTHAVNALENIISCEQFVSIEPKKGKIKEG